MLRKLILASTLLLISCSYADSSSNESGPYLGIQGGWSSVDEGNALSNNIDRIMNIYPGNSISEKQFNRIAGRAFIGINFSKHFSFEAGYSLLPNNTYRYRNYSLRQYLNYQVETNYFDLVGKLILPIENSNWNLYAKFGGAYVYDKFSGESLAQNDLRKFHAICPTYGLGITFNFTKNWALDLAWLGTYSTHKADTILDIIQHNPVPTTNTAMLGIAYKFTAW